jgi:hypothetical protein
MQPIFDWHSQVARGQLPFISQCATPARQVSIWTGDPLRQMVLPNGQNVHISRGIRPTPPIAIGGRRGARGEKKLDSRLLLALRQ